MEEDPDGESAELKELREQILKQRRSDATFWFRMGLHYFERVVPEKMERHLVLLALYYASFSKPKEAESLFLEAISKMEKDKNLCYSLLMAKNMYGRFLMRDPERQEEAKKQIMHSEALAKKLPFWWGTLESTYLSDFILK